MIRFRIRMAEVFHIPLWLLKDMFWMMGFVIPAIILMVPTITLSVIIAIKSYKSAKTFIPNIAVLCWICANSVWMTGEFFGFDFRIKSLALFGIGIVLISYFLLKRYIKERKEH